MRSAAYAAGVQGSGAAGDYQSFSASRGIFVDFPFYSSQSNTSYTYTVILVGSISQLVQAAGFSWISVLFVTILAIGITYRYDRTSGVASESP